MTDQAEVAWARETAARLLVPLGQRWAHTLGVVERARALVDRLCADDLRVLVSAAYLHDVGYAPSLVRTGFHPLDGADFLQHSGRSRLACLVAYHTGARAEAKERGLLPALERFSEERSQVADALTYCDLTTAPDGTAIAPSKRLTDVVARYGDGDPVGRAVKHSRDELLLRACRFANR